jgi:predicted amidophosphoribosyltransferase
MAYRWLELKLPIPDVLIPVPCSFWQKQKLGFDPFRMLAIEMGKLFSTPVQSVLRKTLDVNHFFTHGEIRHRVHALNKARETLCDKKILLIAPLLDDALLRCAGLELKAFFPAQIDALAFASIE